MQTFLPYPSFSRSAAALDDRRLGKQRVEALQILRALHFDWYGWRPHPVVRMWHGFVPALVVYGEAICREWERRGHRDSVRPLIREFRAAGEPDSYAALRRAGRLPPWLGRRAFHRSHQSALIRKDPAHYRPRFPGVPDDLPYVWPEPAPLPEAPELPLRAWVVRADSREALDRFLADEVVFFDEPPPAPRPRRDRRGDPAALFDRAMAIGDRVIALHGDELLVGEVSGPPRARRRRAGRRHLRPVRWSGRLARASIEAPARLQDPRPVFALRGGRPPGAP